MYLDASKTAYFTIYRYRAEFVSDIPAGVPLLVRRTELWWYAGVTFWSDLSSRPNFFCVSNSPRALFQTHSIFSASPLGFPFSFIFMDGKLSNISCRLRVVCDRAFACVREEIWRGAVCYARRCTHPPSVRKQCRRRVAFDSSGLASPA